MAHPEKVQSAIDRYLNEIRRVSQVLDTYLEGRQYLVGDKCTYADIAFIPWQDGVANTFKDVLDLKKDFPNVRGWMERMLARPAIEKVMEDYAAKKEELYGKKL
jgi:glutathione S-transferase